MPSFSTCFRDWLACAHLSQDRAAAAEEYYTVKAGDSLYRIARNHNTTVNELCRLNGITAQTILKIGRRLRVR